MTMTRMTILLAGVLAPALPEIARAQPFGARGRVVLSAENLMGFALAKQDTDMGDVSTTTFSLLSNGSPQTPYDVPRVALDIFAGDGVSLGGFLTYASTSTEVAGTTLDASGVALGGRAGYARELGRRIGFWFRGGLTYYNGENDANQTRKGMGLNLDALLAALLGDHLAIVFGPSFNFGLNGSTEAAGGETDLRFSSYGVTAGLAAMP